ncbi:DgyrCDS5630 [Dimorphilus gyrociliatus]|uniref:DgyrCDS5630 n=1 Tax=Dimorphilus gyrociliatus TaxID=2664684 RepID=A0A7I8VKG9_9ANNE|nr:DgyrCDS5630 [Dimorphilus gyrociliatus]
MELFKLLVFLCSLIYYKVKTFNQEKYFNAQDILYQSVMTELEEDEHYSELQEILKSTLKDKQSNDVCRKKIIIVGAGISGLISALTLKKNGCKVKILEASNRIGGRIYSKKYWNSTFEFGAWQFPTSHKLINILINHTKLPKRLLRQDNHNNYFYIDKRVIKLDTILQHGNEYSNKFLKSAEIVKLILKPLLNEINRIGWRKFVKIYDRYSTKDIFLRKINRETFEYLKKFIWLNTFEDRSIIQYLRTYALRRKTMKYYQIIGGNDKLVKYLSRELIEEIQLESNVLGIRKFFNKFLITTNQSKSAICCQRIEYLADHVIVTVSGTASKYINFDRQFSKQVEPIRSLSYVKEARIAIKCRYPIWHDIGITGGLSRLENHTFVVYPSDSLSTEFYVKMLYYHDNFHKKEFIVKSFRELREIHGNSFTKYCTKYIIHVWENEIYQKSAFGLFKPGQEVIQKQILSMNGNLWFGGEHTSEIRGWVEGALISGLRIAKRILDIYDQ